MSEEYNENNTNNEEQNTCEKADMIENETDNTEQKTETKTTCSDKPPILDSKTVKICISVFIAAFLGSFAAMYFVADKYFEHKFNPERIRHEAMRDKFPPGFRPLEIKDFDDFERRMEQEQSEFFDNIPVRPGIRKNMKHYRTDINPFSVSPVKIKTESDDNKYKIIISLKPFQNNPDKISYLCSGNKITVFGKSETEKGSTVTNVSFSQDFILPENADTESIEKIKDGNKLIISVPVKE